MTNKEITSLALKVFAIYLIVQTIIIIPSFYGLLLAARGWAISQNQFSVTVPVILMIAIVIVVLGLARVIWKLANGVVEKAIESIDTERSRLPDDFQEFTLFLLGLFIFSEAIVGLPSPIATVFYEINNPTNKQGLSLQTGLWISSEILLSIFGLTLIIKREGWVNIYNKLRWASSKR